MKKIILFIYLLAFLSCSSNDEGDPNKEYCWEFAITSGCEGIQSTTTTVKHCNLTEKQAEEQRKLFESRTTVGDITCYVTVTKKKIS